MKMKGNLSESQLQVIINQELQRLTESRRFHESDMEAQKHEIAVALDESLNRFMDAMSDLGIAEEEACEDLTIIVKEFCEDKVSSAYEHQVTYGDEEDDGIYREFVDEFKAIIEAGEEPEDSNFFKTAVRELGEEMARIALDDAIAETED